MSMAAASPDTARIERIHITQGECRVAALPNQVLCTLLGSCVAACIRDPVAAVGGLNHFLLPGEGENSRAIRYGVNAMELLINSLLAMGARRERLEAKLFGGARMLETVSNIGDQNAAFARDFLMREGIRVTGGSLGGVLARRIEFWPVSGRLRQNLTREAPIIAPPPVDTAERSQGAVELF
jgi:chemotaxis protein CheD